LDFGAAAIAGAIEPGTLQAIAIIQAPVKSVRSLLIIFFSLPRAVAMCVKYSLVDWLPANLSGHPFDQAFQQLRAVSMTVTVRQGDY
jgi:hypothetical protein